MVLPDVLAPGLRVVFCGTAASAVSARAGAYYANPQNKFWTMLHLIGLTPRLLQPAEFRELPTWGIGLTDVAKTASGMDREIAPHHYDAARLVAAITRFAPGVLAFTSRRAAAAALGLRSTSGLRYGLHDDLRVGTTRICVLPSPSGAAVRWWDVEPWRELARALPPHQLRGCEAPR